MVFLSNLHQLAIAFDQLLNAFIGVFISLFNHTYKVYADETLSACTYRYSLSYKWVDVIRVLIDSVMFVLQGFKWQHCERAFMNELRRAHSPTEEKE